MKTLNLAILVGLLLTSGCAHQTVHDWCVDHAEHFSSYNECYTERSLEIAARQARGNPWAGMGHNTTRPMSCTTVSGQTSCF